MDPDGPIQIRLPKSTLTHHEEIEIRLPKSTLGRHEEIEAKGSVNRGSTQQDIHISIGAIRTHT